MRVERPTLSLLAATYLLWGLSTTLLAAWSPWLALPVVALCIVMHSSLRHEAIHGHPTTLSPLNDLLVFPALDLVIPYGRFRDTHMSHHLDAALTDPYDDPESNYLDPAVWETLHPVWRGVLQANNTLAGRMLLGPAIGLSAFLRGDLRAILAGHRAVAESWLWHLPAVALVVGWLATVGSMPGWAYALAVYGAFGLLKLRTFLEHRAHTLTRARTAIVEDRGPLALLFLNNNLHAVHHMHPKVAWYRLPALYAAQRARFLACNESYVYRSYREVVARHLLRAKDPVAHPLRPVPR